MTNEKPNLREESFQTFLRIGISEVPSFTRWQYLLKEELINKCDPHTSCKYMWERFAMEWWWLGNVDSLPEEIPEWFRRYAEYTLGQAFNALLDIKHVAPLIWEDNTRTSVRVRKFWLREIMMAAKGLMESSVGDKFILRFGLVGNCWEFHLVPKGSSDYKELDEISRRTIEEEEEDRKKKEEERRKHAVCVDCLDIGEEK